MRRVRSTILFVLVYVCATAQINNGLVAKYSFNNGNSDDDLGKYHARIYAVDLAEDRFGNPNSAYYFHGNYDSYLNLGTSDSLKPKKGSISLWFNWYVLLGAGQGVETNPIISTRAHSGGDCNQAFYIGIDMNTRKLGGSAALSCHSLVTSYTQSKVTMAKWHHVVFNFNDDFLWLYVDGNLEYKVRKNFESQYLAGDSILVGNIQYGKNTRFFVGCIDDIEIFDRVLESEEVTKLFNTPNPNKAKRFITWCYYGLVVIGLVLLIIWLIKWRIARAIKAEKEKNELLNQALEFEIRMLKAQMSPHFVFNSLNTIQQFIIIDENENALLYLSKFSKLMRKLLESNTHDNLSLKDELILLNGYLEIESIRFNKVFKYEITVDEKLSGESIFIPHFLIQPFVENAIWHGLLRKKGDKELSVKFEQENSRTMICTIDDNGIGRKKASTEKPLGKKSIAIHFVKQRLEIMSKMRKLNLNVTIIDKVSDTGESEGTTVKVTLPILN